MNGLTLTVRPGRCYSFFGRNGAGKTTTIKCLLNLLCPTSGTVRVFGLDPQKAEIEVKSRLAYVPDAVAFYPWMTVSDTLNYLASFRPYWNRDARSGAAIALGKIGPDARAAAPSLISCLSDNDRLLRYFAAEALGEIGPGAIPTVESN